MDCTIGHAHSLFLLVFLRSVPPSIVLLVSRFTFNPHSCAARLMYGQRHGTGFSLDLCAVPNSFTLFMTLTLSLTYVSTFTNGSRSHGESEM